MSHNKDAAKEPCSPLFYPYAPEMFDSHPVGPGGNNTLTENNEKGILETGLFRVIAGGKTAELQADHPRQGIYGSSNSD